VTASAGERDVLVRAGRIAAIEREVAASADATAVDGRGKTLLPKLIDAHTHAFGDALAQALVFGVTTELDMFTDPGAAARRRGGAVARRAKAGTVSGRADLFSGKRARHRAGRSRHRVRARDPRDLGPPRARRRSWTHGSRRDRTTSRSSSKIILDDGRTYGPTIPTVSRETLTALVRAAHARGKLAVEHAARWRMRAR
jgi:cytosine/adenosine deaminase-related metal-dependent hydrolase